MLLGAHIGIGAGYDAAVAYARDVGCECIQAFAKNPRSWHGAPLDAEAAASFAIARAREGIGPLFVHTSYLINLCSRDDVMWERSWRALADELVRGTVLEAQAVVTHLGTDPAKDAPAAAVRVADAVARATASAAETLRRPPVRLLLENTAGAGTTFGSGPLDLGAVLSRLDEVLGTGVCIDSCHLHASGTDLSTADGWRGALDVFEESCGTGAIGLVHANDSMFPAGSSRDRHAWIGDGTIGLEGFRAMVCEPRLADVPAVVEMPGEAPVKDAENLRRLKSLRESYA